MVHELEEALGSSYVVKKRIAKGSREQTSREEKKMNQRGQTKAQRGCATLNQLSSVNRPGLKFPLTSSNPCVCVCVVGGRGGPKAPVLNQKINLNFSSFSHILSVWDFLNPSILVQPHESSGVRPSTVPVCIHLLFIKTVLITVNTYTVLTMKVKVTQSCLTLCDPMDYIVHGINSAGQNTGVGSLSLLQGIFPTQGSNPDLPHCIRILYRLSHKGSPRILEWVAYPFSSRSS